jgi:lipopolysaccharide export system protein LptA
LRAASRWVAATLLLAAAVAPVSAQKAADLFSGFQSKSTDPVQVDAQTLEVYEEGKERISVFSGNVTVKRGDTTLKAASIKLHQDTDGKGDAFSKIEAEGGISVKSKDQTLTGKSAVVDMKANSIVVLGTVVLTQGPNTLTGNRLVVDLTTGRARVEGATGTFSPPAQ